MNAQQLKNSILQEAIEGRLVQQDPNDEPASVLLDKIRKEKAKLVKEGKLKKKDLEETPINEEEKLFDIPDSWEWIRINCLGEVITGSTPSKQNKEYYGDDYPFYKPGDLDKGIDICDSVDKLSQKGYDASRKLKANSILVTCIGATIGKSGLISKEGACNQQINAIIPVNSVFPRYIYYAICAPSLQSIIRKDAGQTTLPIMNKNNFCKIQFPLPPLAEQKRIVAKIEELLPKVEEYGKAQDSLDKLNEELPERLKKSILQEAIEGRLVPQDPNEEPASVLLDKIRKEKARLVREGKLKKKDLEETPISEDEIPFKIPDSWEWCKLGTIAALIGGFAFKSHEYTSSGSRVIRISDITENGFINKNVVRFPFTDKLSQYVILEGDILMAMTGGTVGKSLYVKYLPEETMLLNQRVALIRPNIVFTDYIDYVIKSQHIQGIITEAKNSTNDNISMGDLYNFPIPLPPLAEQKRIVAKIEQLMKEINKLKV